MFNVVERALGEVVRSERVLTVSQPEMHSLFQAKNVLDTTDMPVLSNTGLIVRIAKAVGKMMNKAVDEYHIRDIEEASTTAVGDKPSIARLLSHAIRPSRTPSDSDLQEEPRRDRCSSRASSVATAGKIRYRKDVIQCPTRV